MPDISEIPRERAEALLRYQIVRRWVSGKPQSVRTRRLRFMTGLTSQIEETPYGLIRLVKNQGPSTIREMIAELPAHDKSSFLEFLQQNGVRAPQMSPSRMLGRKSVREIRTSKS